MKMLRFGDGSGLQLLLLCTSTTLGMQLDVNEQPSIKETASTIAHGLMSYYKGNLSTTGTGLTGTLPYPPYYWWESGAMWGALIDYWLYTGDTTYLDNTGQGLQAQIGPAQNYIMPQQQFDEGNDDQIFWCLASMTAAEYDLPNPGGPSWAQLSENCWNNQVSRWDTSTCNGGLTWQIYASNVNGLGYKNSISNGGLFQLSARLARFTGNSTYSTWANTIWDWMTATGLMDSNYNIYDGANSKTGCTPPSDIQWTYNVGIFMYGAANMYDITGSPEWLTRVNGLVSASNIFFWPHSNYTSVMYEAACEPFNTCDNDQHSFKGYLARWMAKTTLLVPSAVGAILPHLQNSANGVAAACSGGSDGVTCGTKWYTGGYDNTYGAGQQLASLEAVQALLVANGGLPGKQAAQAEPAPSATSSASPTTTAAPKVTSAVVDKMQAVPIRVSAEAALPDAVEERQADVMTAAPLNTTAIANATAASSNSATRAASTRQTSGSATVAPSPTATANDASSAWSGVEGLVGVVAIALGATLWTAF